MAKWPEGSILFGARGHTAVDFPGLLVEGISVVENLRRKKSHAAEVADVAAKIVKCLTTEDAEKIIKMIKEEKK